jgi:hypothetical protein
VPVYLLARRVLSAPYALAAAALSMSVPTLLFAGMLMTENAFYPAFLLAALAMVAWLERPDVLRTVLVLGATVLAFLTRAQAVALVGAVLTAPLLQRRPLRPFAPLYAVVAAAGGAAAAIAATGGTTRSAPPTITATSELLAPATTVAPPQGHRVLAWPQENGWTIVLATYPVANGGGAARDRAATALQAGLPQVRILLSSNFASLHPGYYVVFSGVYASQDDAQAALPTVARRFRNAAVRPITR